mmetsp:Transcript_24101/g.26369  ORF Transcript_24101/g.26369 Transcript_24101/m.26369 type:complete len:230 (-) Transcript_24101:195-884(-)
MFASTLIVFVLVVVVVVVSGSFQSQLSSFSTSCPSLLENVFHLPSSQVTERSINTIIVKTTQMEELTCNYDVQAPFTVINRELASSPIFADNLLCHEYLLYQNAQSGDYNRVCFTRLIVNGAVIDTTVLVPDRWDEQSSNCLIGGLTIFTNGAKKNEECNVIELPSGYHREHPSMRQKIGETMKALNLNVRNLTTYHNLPNNVTHSVLQLHAINKQHLIMNSVPSFYQL